jgi:hypothetical protein
MKTPIVGSSYVVRSPNAADARMINLFPEIIAEAGKEPAFLQRCPGLRLLATVGTGPVRGLWTFGGSAYVVSGNSLYKVSTNYVVTLLGAVAGAGPVSMADNGTQLFIAANPAGYIYNADTNAFGPISDPDFPGAVTVGYLDGYFVFNPPNSQRIYITSLLDGTQVDPTEFGSAEGSPDGVVAILSNFREIWVFGTNSVEVWYDSGATDFPLQRIQGAYNELGCAAPYSVAKMDNGVFWLGQDARGRGIVYRANGYTGQRISTHAVEWHIQSYGNISDAIAYTYQQDGHSFYVLTFPSANRTWVYDIATNAWHERAGFAGGQFTRHRSNCQVAFNSEIIVGDYQTGKLYAFDPDVYADDGQIQKWLRSWRALPTGQNNLKRTAHHTLQLDCESGVGLNGTSAFDPVPTSPIWLVLSSTDQGYLISNPVRSSGGVGYTVPSVVKTSSGEPIDVRTPIPVQGADPQVMLRWSDDGGHTWSNEHWAGMGRIGEYGHRVFWRRLGMTLKLRDRVYEVSGTDPVKIAIMGAELIVSPTRA